MQHKAVGTWHSPHPGPVLTDVVLHSSLEELVHMLAVQAVHGHADLIMQPLQPEF